MSAVFGVVRRNLAKLIYDAILLASVVLYVGTYLLLAYKFESPKVLPAAIDVRIRAFGSCAFLTIILCIGPPAGCDRKLRLSQS